MRECTPVGDLKQIKIFNFKKKVVPYGLSFLRNRDRWIEAYINIDRHHRRPGNIIMLSRMHASRWCLFLGACPFGI